MLLGIIAVTKAHDGFCVAGINAHGKLIRPIRGKGSDRFWPRNKLTHENGFIKSGDIWELEGNYVRSEFPNHTEDFRPTKFRYRHPMKQEKFMDLLSKYAEGEQEFIDTVNGNQRSLCLVSVNNIRFRTREWDGRISWRVSIDGGFCFDNPKTQDTQYPLKDCKWLSLMNKGYRLPRFEKIFACIGLATPAPYDGVEYPQVIGIHTMPDIKITDNYPD
ncbi:MAG: hypothetical protein SCK29_11735 [Bacillota bacterium]|nr:hypothetical protein [Bacillota bacterium]MDW7684774.1 hypothetical protein [Bacillota bacterium]